MIMIPEKPPEKDLRDFSNEAVNFFSGKSPLKKAPQYGGRPFEYRKQQKEMALAVSEALIKNRNLCAEAPTGIGKSFAYLVPAIHFATQKNQPVIVTTETINLQEQLIQKDIPLLQKMMEKEFEAALAKGRQNYLCFRRMHFIFDNQEHALLPSNSAAMDLDRIFNWSSKTTDGSLSDIDFSISSSVWNYVCCEAGNCAAPKCAYYKKCFYWKARKEWEKADIIVANHALFFTDLKIRQEEDQQNTLLPNYSGVIIDEAHTLEDNAAQHLGLRISSIGLHYFLTKLFNPENGRGLLMRRGHDSLEIRKLVAETIESADIFFGRIIKLLEEKNESAWRTRQPHIVPDTISGKLAEIKHVLTEYTKELDDKELKMELESQAEKSDALCRGVFDFINMTLPEHVYWIEQENNRVSIFAAPLNVNEILEKILFRPPLPVILTSATLSVNRKLDYYRRRTGYTHGEEIILDTPFDFSRQAKIYIPKSIPAPNEEKYTEEVIRQIQNYIAMTHGKAFVLFTSFQLLRTCAEKLEFFFRNNNISLLVQGENLNRTTMLHKFKNDTNSVIFGTASFWTGVDVPGEALSNVIITKLPFAVPTHPLIEARSEKLENSGLNAFMEYSLPEAVLKFRQGIGRLIRSKDDSGIIVILDKRIISKRYGRSFIDSIPACPVNIV